MFKPMRAVVHLLVFTILMVTVGIPLIRELVPSVESLGSANIVAANQTCTLNLPSQDERIIDAAGVLSRSELAELEAFRIDAAQSKCIDVAIMIVPNTNGEALFDYATKRFEEMKPGSENDTGLLMVISKEDKKYFIETGYGLEACMPDGKIGTAAREHMFYPVLDDFEGGKTGGGGMGSTMKASGYGRAIKETLSSLVKDCDSFGSVGVVSTITQSASPLTSKASTILGVVMIMLAIVFVVMVAQILGQIR